ncbi:DUF2516 family protein [Pseudarthrobacter enclensis]|uniref:Cyclic nucleotide-binding domain-containing protein n=2 Tax=Pseudarthrobacter enclensis TaxID=993070 RepID=A0A0V8IGC3_9MICC|nr:DUF2516 family protein [Pseudarthrobacter enclensis]KSU73815.1 hypothetical protein AS031_14040 [Pseudarthrobacter enclensis]MBT2250447.1 DUF2516 family protein [Arthrobacter sp. BHU FT2]BCW18087.1 membrane protein [Arthrobacter sp. NtRootA9]SCC18267.1 Protein of unknown function [Pseudarthrobacter enclensis]
MDGELIIRPVEQAVFFILALVALGLELWAVADCARHKANAFEATGKRTKAFWLALTGGAALVGVISLFASGGIFGTLGLFGLAAVVAASVYLADVRPAVKDAGRGGSRNMGPYGPW